MGKAIVAFGVSESEEIVMLIADTGAETSGFEDGLGEDNLRVFDAMANQCGIKVPYGQVFIVIRHIIIYRRYFATQFCQLCVEVLNLMVKIVDER